MTLLSCLQRIDPGSRHRRECPLYRLLASLPLAAQGEYALRGMWLWGKAHA